MKDIIVINSIDFRGSICDGPGIRTVLFLQGCKRYCFNCHNVKKEKIQKIFLLGGKKYLVQQA